MVCIARANREAIQKVTRHEICGLGIRRTQGRNLRYVRNQIQKLYEGSRWHEYVKKPNVVFQTGQFSPVTDEAYKRIAPSGSVKKAVDSVLAGTDESQEALYFCTKASAAKGNWHERTLEFLFEYGEHRFYK